MATSRRSGKPAAKKTRQDPAFKSRRTLCEHVFANLAHKGIVSFHIRHILVAKHKPGVDTVSMKQKLEELFGKAHHQAPEMEKLTGVILIYKAHSVYMLEGAERYFGIAYSLLKPYINEWYLTARLSLIYNNMNQVILYC